MESLARSNGALARTASLLGAKCGLTLRSSGPSPARHLGRKAVPFVISLAAQAPRRCGPLSSNVRQHHVPIKVLAIASRAAVAAEGRMHSRPTSLQAHQNLSGNAQVPRSALLQTKVSLQHFAATNLCLSMRSVRSVRGAAATRRALPSLTARGGGGLSSSCISSPGWRISDQN